jgi:hypothetical protein
MELQGQRTVPGFPRPAHTQNHFSLAFKFLVVLRCQPQRIVMQSPGIAVVRACICIHPWPVKGTGPQRGFRDTCCKKGRSAPSSPLEPVALFVNGACRVGR